MNSLSLSAQDLLNRAAEALRIDIETLTPKLVQILAIWIMAWLAMRVVNLAARRVIAMVDDGDDTHLSMSEKRGATIAQLLRGVGRIALLAVAALLTVNAFVDISPILAGAGILGLAVSFGAQSLVKDLIGGFFVLMEGTFAVGDIIEVGGKSGKVEAMTLRVVILRDLHGVVHTVPNGELGVISNKTRGWSRAVLEIGVAYEEPADKVLEVFRDEVRRLAEDPTWALRLEGSPEVAGIENLGDSSVNIRVMLRTKPGSQWDVAREFRRRIKNRLDQEGIEIPFPQRTLHLRGPGAEMVVEKDA